MKEKIIDRIRKLLALATSSNENEAQSAMLMAQKLMAQHNIEMSQVEDAPVDHEVVEEEADKKRHRTKWKRKLADVVAHNFKCDIFFRGNGSYATIFVGKKESIEICKSVYNAAVLFIDKEFSKYWNEEGKWLSGFDGTRIERALSDSIVMKDSYARGFIHRLQERFEEQNVKAEQEGWGLVLVKDADVVAHMEAKVFSGKGVSVGASSIDSKSLQQGYRDCNDKFGETGQKKIGG